MPQIKLEDGRTISFPAGLTPEQVSMVIDAASRGQDKRPQSKAPKMTLPQAGSLALESLGKTAGDVGYAVTHLSETAPKLDAAFGAAAKQFGEDPLGTSWGATKGIAQGIKEGARRGIVTTAGLIGQIPGAAQIENLPGGDPAALQRTIEEANLNIANEPVGTALDVAGLPGVPALARAPLRATVRGVTGASKAERLLNEGITPELAGRRTRFGPEATTLDVQPPEPRQRVLDRLAELPKARMDEMNEAFTRRGLLGGVRHRQDVEGAANLAPGSLIQPRAHSGAVAARSRALQEQYTEQATRQRDAAVRARNAASAARTEAARTERNELYPRAFAQHADLPLDNYNDILETPIAKKILEGFAEDEATMQVGRGHGIGNLEKLDKLELQLSRDMENFSPGTIAWNTRRELAQQIRDRIATQFDGVPEMEDYLNARIRHAEVANAPEPTEVPSRQVRMPQNARDALARQVAEARTTENFSRESVGKELRDKRGPDVRPYVPPHLRADVIQGGTNRERAFKWIEDNLPAGVTSKKGWKKELIALATIGGAGWTTTLLGLSPMKAAVGGALLGGVGLARKGRRALVARQLHRQLLDQFPEPEAYVDTPNLPALLGPRGP